MLEKVSYLTDDRDLPEEDLRELVIFSGGNGDWYVQIVPKGGVVFDGVRICTSGGASTQCPGLSPAIAEAYRAMAAATRGERSERPKSRRELEEELEAWRAHFPQHRYEFLRIVRSEF